MTHKYQFVVTPTGTDSFRMSLDDLTRADLKQLQGLLALSGWTLGPWTFSAERTGVPMSLKSTPPPVQTVSQEGRTRRLLFGGLRDRGGH